MKTVSIATEFYKLRKEWKTAESKNWKLAIWVIQHPDIDIVDHFMDIEQSPIGVFNDIFFRFRSVCTKNTEEFEKQLWEEYISWFKTPEDPKFDIIQALQNDGFLKDKYYPEIPAKYTAENLWKELKHFKNTMSIKEDFIIYFPLNQNMNELRNWLHEKLKYEIPYGIKLVSTDIKSERKLTGLPCLELHPKLNMPKAIKNEIDKEGGNYKPNDPTIKFNKQLRKVMESTVKAPDSLKKEVDILINIAKKIKSTEFLFSSYLVASNAFYCLGKHEEGIKYIDKAISITEKEKMNPEVYPNWKVGMMMKAALLMNIEKEDESIELYKELAETALENNDLYTTMEAYRMMASIEYKQGKTKDAWENSLLSIRSGLNLPLDMKRQSTFLHSADLAYKIALKHKTPKEQNILAEYYQEWIGKDWEKLLKENGIFNDHYLNSTEQQLQLQKI